MIIFFTPRPFTMKITIEKTIEILRSCKAVLIDGHTLSFASIWDGDLNDPDETFLQLEVDEENSAIFTPRANLQVKVSMDELFLVDNDGEIFRVKPLFTKHLEHELAKA